MAGLADSDHALYRVYRNQVAYAVFLQSLKWVFVVGSGLLNFLDAFVVFLENLVDLDSR